MKYNVCAWITISAWAEIEASSQEEAQELTRKLIDRKLESIELNPSGNELNTIRFDVEDVDINKPDLINGN